jgi:hypothetical protein
MELLERGAWKAAAKIPLPPELLAKPVFIMDGKTRVVHRHPLQVRCPHGYIRMTVHV